VSADAIELQLPAGRDWNPIARMVLGGIGERLEFGFDELDDIQLAVERLLAEASAEGPLTLSFELHDGHLRARVGPLAEGPLADALQGPEPPAGTIGVRRILDTVVDSYGVESAEDEGLFVRIEKRVTRTA
jgi:hypothetical protein